MAVFGQFVIYRSRILLQIASENKQAILFNFIEHSRPAKPGCKAVYGLKVTLMSEKK
jgi:uncharacterized protein (UPF0548 family)